MPLILPGNVASATADVAVVTNSCRFNAADSAYLNQTFSGGGDTKKWTYSVWVKRGRLTHDTVQSFLNAQNGVFYTHLRMEGTDALDSIDFREWGGSGSGEIVAKLITTRKFRDPSAWYHFVFVYDSANATAGNRQRIYVNNEELSVFSTETQVSQDTTSVMMGAFATYVGSKGTGETWDGYMAESVMIDGLALTPSSFGEYDDDSPTIWKPKDVSGLTFGTNGWYLDFEDSSDLGKDVSGNSNDFTSNNLAATDQSTDTPVNNFCTMNPLATTSYTTLSEGNTISFGNTSTNLGLSYGTFAPNGGKWYMECKVTVSGTYPRIAIQQINENPYGKVVIGGDEPGKVSAASGWWSSTDVKYSNDTSSNGWSGDTWSTNDIISMAFDCDNGACYMGINNLWENSGDPTSGASKTGAFVTWTPADSDGVAPGDLSYNGTYLKWNFGNPSYANSSDAADGNGYGAFEYAPPSGYLALCTKNLGSDGG